MSSDVWASLAILFLLGCLFAAAVYCIRKVAQPESDEEREARRPISPESMRVLCQRLDRERTLDPNRQS